MVSEWYPPFYEVKEALKELEESQLSVEREITVSIATGIRL